jgi:hypothetical protein
MVLAAWVESASTFGASAAAVEVLVHGQNMFALSTEHRILIPSCLGPDFSCMRLECIVTADARVELVAAEMLDGDDVEQRVPMCALCEWSD